MSPLPAGEGEIMRRPLGSGKTKFAERAATSSLSTMASEGELLLDEMEAWVNSESPLESSDLTAEAVAAYAAAQLKGDEAAVAKFTELLSHGNWEVRAASVDGLVKVAKPGDRRVMASLTGSMMNDSDSIVRYAAWEALGAMEKETGWGCSSPR
eukprot:TRINITY_DN63779_c0_g1_i1.p2 TRINITY_DN63779_c0_g1~~TRINITY_DN63779_c0_g1_i1.p2  ORF type:complete len:154 (-),score=40.15 TRINITY_DN63779_c0_g1_i1:32-493(-)